MLTKEYDTKNYNDLEQDINNFMNSSGYKSYIKKCSKLSLQTSYNNLIEFSQIPIEYSMFLKVRIIIINIGRNKNKFQILTEINLKTMIGTIMKLKR